MVKLWSNYGQINQVDELDAALQAQRLQRLVKWRSNLGRILVKPSLNHGQIMAKSSFNHGRITAEMTVKSWSKPWSNHRKIMVKLKWSDSGPQLLWDGADASEPRSNERVKQRPVRGQTNGSNSGPCAVKRNGQTASRARSNEMVKQRPERGQTKWSNSGPCAFKRNGQTAARARSNEMVKQRPERGQTNGSDRAGHDESGESERASEREHII